MAGAIGGNEKNKKLLVAVFENRSRGLDQIERGHAPAQLLNRAVGGQQRPA